MMMRMRGMNSKQLCWSLYAMGGAISARTGTTSNEGGGGLTRAAPAYVAPAPTDEEE